MFRTPAHWSSLTFTELVTQAGGENNIPTQLYNALHIAQGVNHPSFNLETRVPFILNPEYDDETDEDYIEFLWPYAVGWLEYALEISAVPRSEFYELDLDDKEGLQRFLAMIHRSINDQFNLQVVKWQTSVKAVVRATNELNAVKKTGKASEEKMEELEFQLATATTDFADVQVGMVNLRKLEAVSRYLPKNTDENAEELDAMLIPLIQAIVFYFPTLWLGVLNTVDGWVLPEQ